MRMGRRSLRLWSCLLALIVMALLFPISAMAADAPKVITLNPMQYAEIVTFRGTVVNDGGAEVLDNGFFYGTDKNKLDKKIISDRPYELSVDIDLLQPSTTYYVQAYAANESGESRGDVVTFRTDAAVVYVPPQSEVERLAADIRKQFGVQVLMENRAEWNTTARYIVASDAENKRALTMLRSAMAKYPQRFFSKMRLRYIVLGKNVTNLKGATLSGTSLGNIQQTMMLINVRAPEQVVHHELFHCFEYASGYLFYDWKRTNVTSFKYNEGANLSDTSMLPPGFMTRYSTTQEAEDRAEIFTYMMTDSYRATLIDQAAHDSVIKAKVQILNKELKRYFGKIADKSRFVDAASQVAAASKPRILGTALVESTAELYDGPDVKTYIVRKEAKQGALMQVVQRDGQWLKVLDTDGKTYYYVQEKDVSYQPPQRSDDVLSLNKAS